MKDSSYGMDQIRDYVSEFDNRFPGTIKISKSGFVFSGHGTEWVAMGKKLIQAEPLFEDSIRQSSAIYESYANWSIYEELMNDSETSKVSTPLYAHPCLIAIGIALTDLLYSRGVKPDGITGHSVGEVSACYAAGVLSREDAFKVVWHQNILMAKVTGKGKMLFIAGSRDDLRPFFEKYGNQITLAATNSHHASVISGDEAILQQIYNTLEAEDTFARMLNIDIPFHSPVIKPHIAELESALADLKVNQPEIPIYSTLKGRIYESGDYDGKYWADHISEPVLFVETVDSMITDGYNVFIEVGPHPAHLKDLLDCLDFHNKKDFLIGGTLKKGTDDQLQLLTSLAYLHTRGLPLHTSTWSQESARLFDTVLAEFTRQIMSHEQEEIDYSLLLGNPSTSDHKKVITELIRKLLKRIARVNEEKSSDYNLGFMAMGVNSLMAVQLKELLSHDLGIKLPNTLLFNYPNINRLSDYLASKFVNAVDDQDKPDMDTALLEKIRMISDEEAAEQLAGDLLASAPGGLTHNQKLLFVIEQMKSRGSYREPIAVIGMGCRMPAGANDPEKFWELLDSGLDGTSQVPADRWNADEFYEEDRSVLGKAYTKRGGFLKDFDPYAFDGNFFRISPKELQALDPQQRLLLEVSAEAFESAAIPLDSLNGKNVGVYVGICSDDYKGAHLYSGDLDKIDAYSLLGTALSASSGRISFTFGMQGPNVAVDTACSSSLVAMHLAVRALRNRECDMAIAGGVNYLLNPVYFIYFSKLQAISPDGRCKAFDASADGYARGEGCGIVVMKRLSEALENNDNILAIVKGSALNQDGASTGFTAPNGIAQEKLVAKALDDAGLKPTDVDYVEAHGTGTPLGDPIEVTALANVYGKGREMNSPLIIGSVKSNIGHLEGGAGVTGILKIILAMQHNRIPKNLHFNNPNPDVDWENLPVKVPKESQTWLTGTKKRIAGVSGFGFSGSNAHVIFEEAPTRKIIINKTERPLHLFTLSARDEEGLEAYVDKYLEFLPTNKDKSLADICYTASIGRSHYQHRLGIVCNDHDDLISKLKDFKEDKNNRSVYKGSINSPFTGKTAFLFTGQGSQYFAMSRELYRHHPDFSHHVDQCSKILEPNLGLKLTDILFNDEGDTDLINQTAYTQPGIFVIEYALAKLWESIGIRPDVVMGHSVGEYVAACISGIMSLEDSLMLIAERGRLMQQLPEGGAMAAVFASVDIIKEHIAPFGDKLSVAASNSPSVNTISGDGEAMDEAMEKFKAANIKSKKLVVSHAFHSSLMDPMLEEFKGFAGGMTFNDPITPLISNVFARPISREDITPSYWCEHVRGTVNFKESLEYLVKNENIDVFVEIGSDITLSGLGKQCLPGGTARWHYSLKRNRNDWEEFLGNVAAMYTAGHEIDWEAMDAPYARNKLMLPTYPFQRRRYYMNPYNYKKGTSGVLALSANSKSHAVLGTKLESPLSDKIYVNHVNTENLSIINDHIIFNVPLLSATSYIEMGLEAGTDHFGESGCVVRNLHLNEAMLFPSNEFRDVQSVVTEKEDGVLQMKVFSRHADSQETSWKLHATLNLVNYDADNATNGKVRSFDKEEVVARIGKEREGGAYYETLDQKGYLYSNEYRSIDKVWMSPQESLGSISSIHTENEHYSLDPGILDSCLQMTIASFLSDSSNSDSSDLIIPIEIDKIKKYAPLAGKLWIHCEMDLRESNNPRADVLVQNDQGHLLVEINGILMQRITRDAFVKNLDLGIDHILWNVNWEEVKIKETEPELLEGKNLLLFGDNSEFSKSLQESLEAQAAKLHTATAGSGYREDRRNFILDPIDKNGFVSLLNSLSVKGSSPDKIIFAWGLQKPGASVTEVELEAAMKQSSGSLLALMQALLTLNQKPDIHILTRNAVRLPNDEAEFLPAGTVLRGFRNVIEWEAPQIFCNHIDISEGGAADLQSFLDEIRIKDNDHQIAIRGKSRYAARFTKQENLKNSRPNLLAFPETENYKLDIGKRGIIDNLQLIPTPKVMPGPNEILMRVHANGLNFRDVLNALGRYPGTDIPFGLECSGEVVSVGSSVTRFKEGDRVMANSLGSFSKFVTVGEVYTVHIPENLSFDEAVTIPGTFLTAYYGLVRLGQMKAKDKVFIHAGAGGVGMAAIQLALWKGAEVFSTAGSEEKRTFLKEMGVHHVFNSRTLDFADEVMKITDGKGVDLLLNSLAGEFMDKSFSVMAENGRFIEMGKNNLWSHEQVNAFNSTLEYHPFDLAAAGQKDPEIIRTMFSELLPLFSDGSLRPLPMKVFDMAEIRHAFSFMAQARHIGKIVISQRSRARIESVKESGVFSKDATYLLTGGLGALGLLTAKWMAGQGAGRLVLLSRKGLPEEKKGIVSEIESLGSSVTVLAADSGSEKDMLEVLKTIRESMPPLKGIMHIAGVLDDAMLLEQSWHRMDKVYRAKVYGSWLLHNLTKHLDLDFFVLYSSISSLFGNRGQANYSSANAFLDGLAEYRRSEGLAATSLNWGPWAEVGMAVGNENLKALIAKQGFYGIKPEDGLLALDKALREDLLRLAVVELNQNNLLNNLSPAMKNGFFASLTARNAAGNQSGSTKKRSSKVDVYTQLLLAGEEGQFEVLENHLKELTARILGFNSIEEVATDKQFRELGFDSLTSAQFINMINESMNLDLSQAVYLEFPTISKLSTYILGLKEVGERVISAKESPGSESTQDAFKEGDKSKDDRSFASKRDNPLESIEDAPKPRVKTKVKSTEAKKKGFFTRLLDRINDVDQ